MFQAGPSNRITWFGLLAVGLVIFAFVEGAQRPDGERATATSISVDLNAYVQEGLLSIADEVSDRLMTYRMLLHAQEEMGQLRREAQRTASLKVQLRQVQEENRLLRRWASFPDAQDHFRPLGVRVIGRHKTATGEVLRINQGRDAGIRKGDGVVNVDHQVVGRVLWVSNRAADVTLATHPSSAIDVLVERSRAYGMARGNGKGNDRGLTVGDFDRLMDVQVGDRLVTAGANRDFPAGLPVARIDAVAPTAEGVYLRAEATWSAPTDRLEVLWVLRTQKPERAPRLGRDLAEPLAPLPPEPLPQMPAVASKGSSDKEPTAQSVINPAKVASSGALSATVQKTAPEKKEPAQPKKSTILEIEELKKFVSVIAPSGVKIRSGPGPEHWVVGTKFKGATLAATGKVKGKDWIRVSLPTGIQGYVFAPLLADVTAQEKVEQKP